MATWKGERYGYTSLDLGVLRLTVGWGLSRGDQFVVQGPGFQKTGFADRDVAQEWAEEWAREHLTKALAKLGPAAPKPCAAPLDACSQCGETWHCTHAAGHNGDHSEAPFHACPKSQEG